MLGTRLLEATAAVVAESSDESSDGENLCFDHCGGYDGLGTLAGRALRKPAGAPEPFSCRLSLVVSSVRGRRPFVGLRALQSSLPAVHPRLPHFPDSWARGRPAGPKGRQTPDWRAGSTFRRAYVCSFWLERRAR